MSKSIQMKRRMAALLAMALTSSTLSMPIMAKDYNGHWAADAIEKWVSKEVIKGYEDGSFKPEQPVTRAELAALIARVFGLTHTEAMELFDDVPENKWYTESIKRVSSADIMYSERGLFRPNDYATREEAAYTIARAYKISNGESTGFLDEGEISGWAEDEVAALVAGNYIHGRPDGTFDPKATLTRAECIAMIDKMMAELFNQAGTYSNDVKGNVVINTKDVVLKDMTIEGNLYIAEGVEEGEIILDGVNVTGQTFIEGGGSHSIELKGKTKLGHVEIDKSKGSVRLVSQTDKNIETVIVKSDVILEGKFEKVYIEKANNITLEENSSIESLEVASNVKNTKVLLNKGSKVKQVLTNSPIVIAGEGLVDKVILGKGITLKDLSIQVKTNKIEDMDGKVIQDNSKPSSSGGGSSSGGNDNGGGTVNPPTQEVSIQNIQVTTSGALVLVNADVNHAPITTDAQITLKSDTVEVIGSAKINNGKIAYTFTGIENGTYKAIITVGKVVAESEEFVVDTTDDFVINHIEVGYEEQQQYLIIRGQGFTRDNIGRLVVTDEAGNRIPGHGIGVQFISEDQVRIDLNPTYPEGGYQVNGHRFEIKGSELPFVARIGAEGYGTLEEALVASQQGDTIVLLKNDTTFVIDYTSANVPSDNELFKEGVTLQIREGQRLEFKDIQAEEYRLHVEIENGGELLISNPYLFGGEFTIEDGGRLILDGRDFWSSMEQFGGVFAPNKVNIYGTGVISDRGTKPVELMHPRAQAGDKDSPVPDIWIQRSENSNFYTNEGNKESTPQGKWYKWDDALNGFREVVAVQVNFPGIGHHDLARALSQPERYGATVYINRDCRLEESVVIPQDIDFGGSALNVKDYTVTLKEGVILEVPISRHGISILGNGKIIGGEGSKLIFGEEGALRTGNLYGEVESNYYLSTGELIDSTALRNIQGTFSWSNNINGQSGWILE